MYEHVTLQDNGPQDSTPELQIQLYYFPLTHASAVGSFRWKKAKLMQRLTWFIATLLHTCAWGPGSFWLFYELPESSGPRGGWWIRNGSVLSTALKLWFTNCEINIKFSITTKLNFDSGLFPCNYLWLSEEASGPPSSSTAGITQVLPQVRLLPAVCVWPLKEIVCKNVAVFLFARYLKLNYWTH